MFRLSLIYILYGKNILNVVYENECLGWPDRSLL